MQLFTYIKGFVRISVAGRFLERFLNICTHRNIYVWNIKNHGKELMHLNMSVDGFKKMPSVAYKSKARVRIISRHGLPFILKKHRKRKVFAIAGAVGLLLFLYLTSFVWVIDVEGNVKVDKKTIVSALEEHGFRTGTFRYGVDVQQLQNKMLLSVDDLSWLWVEIRGTRAVVKVKEKTPIPHIVDYREPCNLVAVCDGLITEVNITYGEKMVSIGDIVKKGELLASGISSTKYGGIHYLHSSGSVKARTWHSKSGEFPLTETKISKTGKKISKNTMNFFGFRVKLYRDINSPYEYWEVQEGTHYISLSENLVFPLGYESNTFYELHRTEVPISREQAIEIACAELSSQLDDELPDDITVVNKTYNVTDMENGNIYVEMNYECVRDIAVEMPIDTQ